MLVAMKRVRAVESRIESEYSKDEMKTPVHLSIGQEGVCVGVCSQLRRDDYVFGGHRSHGPYLAKGGDLKAMMAELYCRETGCSSGRGGSMHLLDQSVGMFGTSAIVGGTVPIAAGAALASQRLKQDRVAVSFFGDAAIEEGGVIETINAAQLWNLPVVFVCENNFYSVCSHIDARQKTRELAPRVAGFGLPAVVADGADVVDVAEKTRAAVERAREGVGPTFIEARVYRWRAHSGAGDPGAEKYRDPELEKEWKDRCPIKALEERLELTVAELAEIQSRIEAEIDDAFAYAKASPLPAGSDLAKHVFWEGSK